MMKMKLALFMFAIGLGSSFAYAAGVAGGDCAGQCYRNYNFCMNVNGDAAFCQRQQTSCLQRCGIQEP
ncbi:hypothetical protein [Rugamonas sp. DEMB1]|uniref:hypothetical protein n=1 Tax=Rugamonas sp. DEMB1 TaxID=3039386 RepID=UPI00244C8B13|nr:hypothetical protein [Rugamonas sp. DEMB1]WGG52240.1 hypothetical protein QC826_08735 [Rugamonas sp. DEMB1]